MSTDTRLHLPRSREISTAEIQHYLAEGRRQRALYMRDALLGLLRRLRPAEHSGEAAPARS